MRIKGYVEKKQPILYRTFSGALEKGVVTHSYLLLGEAGIPLKEIAVYLAKSLLCDHPNPLADEECICCQRIENEEYPDLVILDGSENAIKKEEVLNLVNGFQKTPLEKKGIMIYIVNMVENMGVEAVNSLLKFLEEPTPNTYAILTSQNESKVLPTIISRCQSIRLRLSPIYEVIQEAVALGVSQQDAEILANFYNDADLVKEQSQNSAYQGAKKSADAFLDALNSGFDYGRYIMEKAIAPVLGAREVGKSSARFFFDILILFFQDICRKNAGDEIKLSAYATIIGALAEKLPHAEQTLLAIMNTRGDIERNVNMGLLLAHVAHIITKE
ncbi:MAG: hypothetical protein J5736_00275 [Bacilli bacterium]|nr:hypothetical protein [Bacilli bacterium]